MQPLSCFLGTSASNLQPKRCLDDLCSIGYLVDPKPEHFLSCVEDGFGQKNAFEYLGEVKEKFLRKFSVRQTEQSVTFYVYGGSTEGTTIRSKSRVIHTIGFKIS